MTDDATSNEPTKPPQDPATPPPKPGFEISDEVKKAFSTHNKAARLSARDAALGKSFTQSMANLNIGPSLSDKLKQIGQPPPITTDYSVSIPANPNPHITAAATANTAENTADMAAAMPVLIQAIVNESELNQQDRDQKQKDQKKQNRFNWTTAAISTLTLLAAIAAVIIAIIALVSN